MNRQTDMASVVTHRAVMRQNYMLLLLMYMYADGSVARLGVASLARI